MVGQASGQEGCSPLDRFQLKIMRRLDPLGAREMAFEMDATPQFSPAVGPSVAASDVAIPGIGGERFDRVDFNFQSDLSAAKCHLHTLYETGQPLAGGVEQLPGAGDLDAVEPLAA